MNSSLAALIAPSSGVAQAVSGYLVGMGDGVTTVFTAPPEITSLSALYRRDWQGAQVLSLSPRTNYALYSQDLNSWAKTDSPTVICGAKTLGALSLDLVGDYSAIKQPRLQEVVVLATPGVKKIKVFVAKGPSSTTNSSITLYESTAAAYRVNLLLSWSGPTPVVSMLAGVLNSQIDLGSGIWELSITTTGIESVSNVLTFAFHPAVGGNSSTGDIYIGGFQLSDTEGSYIPTTTAPVTVTDYAASGNTITLAETPVRAAEISLDGTATGLPLIQIR